MLFRLPAVAFLLFALTTCAFAQALGNSDDAEAKVENLSEQALFEDANGYLGRRYQEFNKQKLPFDPKLEEKTKKEQHDLALKNAGIVRPRTSLDADDLHCLGLLYHLATEADDALSTMQRRVKEEPDCAKA